MSRKLSVLGGSINWEAYEVQAARHAEQPAGDHRQANKPDRTKSMVRDRVETDGQGDVCRRADEAQVEHVRNADDDLQRQASHDLRHVHDISDRGVGAVELNQDVGGVRGDYPQDNDCKYARNDPKGMHSAWQRQYTDAYLISEEDQRCSSHPKFLASIVVFHSAIGGVMVRRRRRIVRRGLSFVVSSVSALRCVWSIAEVVRNVAVSPH